MGDDEKMEAGDVYESRRHREWQAVGYYLVGKRAGEMVDKLNPGGLRLMVIRRVPKKVGSPRSENSTLN